PGQGRGQFHRDQPQLQFVVREGGRQVGRGGRLQPCRAHRDSPRRKHEASGSYRVIEPVTAIVLAAQRDGQLDPLAAEAGVSHKCRVPIGGRPLLAHVLDALARTEGVARIRISVEAGAQELLGRVALTSGVQGVPVDFVTSEATITDSIYAASRGGDAPYL